MRNAPLPCFAVSLPFFKGCISFTWIQRGLPQSNPLIDNMVGEQKRAPFRKSLFHGPILLPVPLLTTLKILPLPQAKWPHWLSLVVLRSIAEILLFEVSMAAEEKYLRSPSHSLGQIVKTTMTVFLCSFLPCILLLPQPPGVSVYRVQHKYHPFFIMKSFITKS